MVERPLDHFLQTRGAAILGQTSGGRTWKVQAAIGAGCLGLAGLMGTISVLAGAPGMAYGAIGPGIAGTINFTLGMVFRAINRRHGAETPLSPEARLLLHALVLRSTVWQGGFRARQAAMHSPTMWGIQSPPVEPSPEAMAMLDRAAEAYNRLAQSLGEARDERSARIRAAADAGMVEMFERTVLLSARPHDSILGLEEMEDTVDRLTELADRIETTRLLPEGTNNLRSTLDATLQELRAEDAARRELQAD